MAHLFPQIAASIMCADPLQVETELEKLTTAGVKWLHADVMDGLFVDNLAMAPYNLAPILARDEFVTDIHLAVTRPERYIEMFAPLAPDYLTFHVEATKEPGRLIEMIHQAGCGAGLAINPSTKPESVLPYLAQIDYLLVMTVAPGFAGQKFCLSGLENLRFLKKQIVELEERPIVAVDGNIYAETVKQIGPGQADLYIVGTAALFNNKPGNYEQKLAPLFELL
ncbi:ribulose-phosphate 3-epimerase [Listeria ilorinensis]|uniref:ribulose-phosphate 3-epimerase n=1 Tax=Listeria ilorinensis TaxID=2867439 RepID=UPI001EF70B14|nr:ribulose-phosphate 3-epimerase [Listeria ilorinensis]